MCTPILYRGLPSFFSPATITMMRAQANSAILNTLLTLINERLFDNGSQRVGVPLITMVGASNELPESEELDALYDRFLVRKLVKQVSSAGKEQ